LARFQNHAKHVLVCFPSLGTITVPRTRRCRVGRRRARMHTRCTWATVRVGTAASPELLTFTALPMRWPHSIGTVADSSGHSCPPCRRVPVAVPRLLYRPAQRSTDVAAVALLAALALRAQDRAPRALAPLSALPCHAASVPLRAKGRTSRVDPASLSVLCSPSWAPLSPPTGHRCPEVMAQHQLQLELFPHHHLLKATALPNSSTTVHSHPFPLYLGKRGRVSRD